MHRRRYVCFAYLMRHVENIEHVDRCVQAAVTQTELAQETKISSEIVGASLAVVGAAISRTATRGQNADESLIQSAHRQDPTIGETIQITEEPAETETQAGLPGSNKPRSRAPVEERAAVRVDRLIGIVDHNKAAPVVLKRSISRRSAGDCPVL